MTSNTAANQEQETFSLHFNEGDTIRSLDWNWGRNGEKTGRWTKSTKERNEGWYGGEELTEKDFCDLLDRFGIDRAPYKAYALQFTDTIVLTPPSKLAYLRRIMETARGIPRKEIISDTMGFHVSADDFRG